MKCDGLNFNHTDCHYYHWHSYFHIQMFEMLWALWISFDFYRISGQFPYFWCHLCLNCLTPPMIGLHTWIHVCLALFYITVTAPFPHMSMEPKRIDEIKLVGNYKYRGFFFNSIITCIAGNLIFRRVLMYVVDVFTRCSWDVSSVPYIIFFVFFFEKKKLEKRLMLMLFHFLLLLLFYLYNFLLSFQ
jgi:hypothetical protein